MGEEGDRGSLAAFRVWLGAYCTIHPEYRFGLAFFTGLTEQRPDLAHRLQFDTDLDPFHDDSKLAAAVMWIEENW